MGIKKYGNDPEKAKEFVKAIYLCGAGIGRCAYSLGE